MIGEAAFTLILRVQYVETCLFILSYLFAINQSTSLLKHPFHVV